MLAMSARHADRLRLTVLGCSTAAPHPDWPASGHLVEWGETRLLLDAGPGVVRRLQRSSRPADLSAVIVGHMHADHYLDLVALRYLFPWGEAAARPLPVFLPPGGRGRLDALATAISERAGFFDAAFAISEFDPETALAVGPLVVRFVRGRHYVPAWGVVIEAPDGARIAYTGDTGPSDAVSRCRARGGPAARRGRPATSVARRPGTGTPHRRGGDRDGEPGARPGGAPRALRPGPRRPSSRPCARPPAPGSLRPSSAGPSPSVRARIRQGTASRHAPPTAASASAARDR